MTIQVRLFAILREHAGRSELMLELPEGATAGDVIALLLQRLPVLRPHARAVAIAVNQAYAPGSTKLHEGDEVALIPPVSGG